ncbi:MAG: DNA gyrase C-terminal beta-propeller domain-containing protein [Anaerolineae bacterium]
MGKEDSLVAGSIIEPDEQAQVVLVSQTGFAKRVPLAEFPLQGRSGQGVQSLEITKVTGKVAAATVATGQAKMGDVISARGCATGWSWRTCPWQIGASGDKLIDFGADDAIVVVVGL